MRILGGRELLKELIRIGIPEDRIVKLNAVFTDRKNDFAMEDVLSADFYHKAVMAAYPSNPITQQNGKDKKISKLYEDEFKATYKIGFNKRRVAEAAKRLLKDGVEDEETRNSLGTLSGVLIKNLKEQIPTAVPASS